MKKSLNLLLAFALVFSMFSTAVFAADSQSAAQKLVNAGIIKGSNSGDLMENETWKRQDVTVIISRLLGVEQEAKNTPKNHSFADVTDPYYDGFITYAYQNGYFNGHSEIRFGYGEEITVKQFAAVMLRVLGYDVAWDEVEEVAVDVGLVPAGTDFEEAATRGEYFVIIDTTLQTETADGEILGVALGLPGYAPEAPEVAVKPVGAKKIEVAFNKAVNKDQVTISVKKGNNTTNVDSITWSADNKTATVNLSAKMTKGEYTVTVKGAAADDYVLSFTAEDEKVAKVEITSDKAPMVDNQGKEINLFFRALNQYGENVTRAHEFIVMVSKGEIENANDNKINGGNGKLKAKLDTTGTLTYSLNEQIIFTVTYADNQGNFATDQKTLTVAAPAKVSSIELTELYNKDGKQLMTTTNLNNDLFYILVDAKDQYGNNVTADQMESDTVVANLGAHLIDYAGFETINDGVKENVIGLKLKATSDGVKAGTARFTVYATAANASGSFDVEIIQASQLDTLILHAPDVIPAGEKVEIPYEAYDQNGNAIDTYTKLVNGMQAVSSSSSEYFSVGLTGSPNPTLRFEHDPETNKAKLYLDLSGVDTEYARPFVITGRTETNKFINTTFTLSPKAKAVAIVKVDKIDRAVAKQDGSTSGGVTKLELKNIFVEDQYGRTLPASDFSGRYAVTVTGNVYQKLAISGITPATNGNIPDTQLSASHDLTGGTATGLTTLTLKLKDLTVTPNKDVANSDYKLNIRTVGKADIVSYTVEVAGTVYYDVNNSGNRANYGQEIKVKGQLSDGTSVAVPVDETNGYMTLKAANGLLIDGKEIRVAPDSGTPLTKPFDFGNDKERTYALSFIGETKTGAQPEVVDVKVSVVAPAADSFKLKSQDDLDGAGYGNKSRKSDHVLNISKTLLGSKTLTDIANDVVEVRDQYGKMMADGQFVSASVLSYSNTNRKAVSEVPVGESFKVVAFTNNAKRYEFTINVIGN